jgi:DNA-binding SARP family transcriptional activator
MEGGRMTSPPPLGSVEDTVVPTIGTAFELSLLGQFTLHRGGEPVRVRPSGQRLLALLALCGGARPRAFIAGTLWGDASDERAAAALRTTLWRIGRPAADLVRTDGDTLALANSVRVDLVELSGKARAVVRAEEPDAAGAELDVLLDARELLPGWYDDWVIVERERFRQARVHALEALCLGLSAQGRHGPATEAGMAAVACEPLRESAHRALVTAHLTEGNAVEALRQYALFEELIDRQLGLEPSPVFSAMLEPVRRR